MGRPQDIKRLRDWLVDHRTTTCRIRECSFEGLQYRENYGAAHVLELHEEVDAPVMEIEAHAYVYDEDDAPTSVEIFCSQCGSRVVLDTKDVPAEILDLACAFKVSMREEPNG